jgi:para-aminobenzoate synthetase/4-amino-4-deoxychorismate lyase
LSSTDALARHKTNWRELYDGEWARLCPPFDEVLFLNEHSDVVEGSRTNIFIERDGLLLTPPLDAGALDGVLRQSLIAEGRCREAVLTQEDLSGGFYLGNSLRGLIKATLG